MPRLIVAHLSEPPPRPSITRSDVPAQVDEVIATGMAKDPDQRYATTVELADAAHNAVTAPLGLTAQNHATRAAFVTPAVQTMPAAEAADLNLDTTQQATSTPSRKPWWPPGGRTGLIAAIAAAVVLLVAGAITFRPQQPSGPPVPSAAPTTQPAPLPPPPPPIPVEEAALEGLLLSPDQINTAMGTTGMMADHNRTVMDDDSTRVPDQACRPLDGPLLAPVYAGSGWSAFREQVLQGPLPWTHRVDQGVVLFSSAHDAAAFFTVSAQQWPACTTPAHAGLSSLGPVSNTDGTLSATETYWGGTAIVTCQRALTVANNVAIDISACSSTNLSDSGVNIAHQIAAKVPTT